MAFKLIFYKPSDFDIVLDDVVSFFSNNEHFKIKPLDNNHYIFEYRNEITKVNFVISYNEAIEITSEINNIENYEYCYTVFSIPYLRPTFYALEAMPIVEEFAKKFHLAIIDLQNTQDKLTLKSYTKEELIDTYIENNTLVANDFNKQYPLAFTDRKKTDFYYAYTVNEQELSEKYKTHVPEISFIKNIETNEVYTVFTWEDAKPTILAPCDYVYILRTYKGFLGIKKQKASLVPFSDIERHFKDLWQLTEDNLYLINKEHKDRFYELPDADFSQFEIIDTDEIIDVPLNDE